ncbi:unnamed protein product [Thlaspi arvense]|uniref:Malectin-like domain-containing protein n=1 Tax=Thlaspi arvense TaxID=13288 RepID=A0AAU9RWY9_THLAR|nr:unnamed protein product [Thlaspi arvense]
MNKEIIHTPRSDHFHVCLVDKDRGPPFLSVLELRLLNNDTYETPYDSLMLNRRWDLGALGDRPVRYKDDVYDRIWNPLKFPNHRVLSTNLTIDPNNNIGFQPARAIMNTASTPIYASVDIIIYWIPETPSWKYYVYMHFADVQEIPSNETSEFSVFWNDETNLYENFSPRFLYTDTLYTQSAVTGPSHEFRLQRTANSTLPPIINAVETYRVNEFLQPPTDQQDIMRIKSKYGVNKNWLGDPCAPVKYPWRDIDCSYVDNESPRIISVLGGNADLCVSASCQTLDLKTQKSAYIVPLVASVVGVFGLVIAIALFLLYKKRHQSGLLERKILMRSLQVALVVPGMVRWTQKVVKVTNKFERVLGHGGFGKVYHGVFSDDQVAVKILSESSPQGYK